MSAVTTARTNSRQTPATLISTSGDYIQQLQKQTKGRRTASDSVAAISKLCSRWPHFVEKRVGVEVAIGNWVGVVKVKGKEVGVVEVKEKEVGVVEVKGKEVGVVEVIGDGVGVVEVKRKA